jgi:hypothetical protein
MQYRRSIFTFLDVLGFREMVPTKTPEEIGELLTRLREHTKPDDLNAKMLEIQFQTFSDCTVRAVPLDSPSNREYPSGILFWELLNLVHAQYRLLHDGYFMRGGVVIDEICFEGLMVFGPAMNRAYRLESEFAVYPRIAIDPGVFVAHEKEPLLRNDLHDAATEHEYFRACVRKDTDGIYFVDYLRGMVTEFDEEGMEFDFFMMHKKRILEGAGKHQELNKVAAKYLWLATYHNGFMREIGEKEFIKRGLNLDDYVISSDEMPLVYELRNSE